MRKMMMLASMLALMLVAAAPAFAQTDGDLPEPGELSDLPVLGSIAEFGDQVSVQQQTASQVDAAPAGEEDGAAAAQYSEVEFGDQISVQTQNAIQANILDQVSGEEDAEDSAGDTEEDSDSDDGSEEDSAADEEESEED